MAESQLNRDIFLNLKANDPDDCPGNFSHRSLVNWMSFIRDDVKLINLAIPGSHDSATYSMRDTSLKGIIGDAFGRTQNFNLLGQLLLGIRYLDLRCKQDSQGAIFCHGSISGRPVENLIESQVRPFIENFPDQFIILDFQQLDNQCELDVKKIIEKHLNPAIWAVPTDKFNPNMTLGELRRNDWRYVVLWSDGSYDKVKDDPNSWVVKRGDVIHSPYDEKTYMGATQNIPAWLNQQCGQWEKEKKKLFVAQGISTTVNPKVRVGIPRPPLEIERTDGHILNDWIWGLNGESSVNIIIRDSVDWYFDVIAKIISLNQERGWIKSAEATKFDHILNGAMKFKRRSGKSTTLEVGIPNLLGAETILNEEIRKDSSLLRTQKHEWDVHAPQDNAITWFKIESVWTDGTNGTFEVKDGWVFEEHLNVYVESENSRGFHWRLQVQAARINPEYFGCQE